MGVVSPEEALQHGEGIYTHDVGGPPIICTSVHILSPSVCIMPIPEDPSSCLRLVSVWPTFSNVISLAPVWASVSKRSRNGIVLIQVLNPKFLISKDFCTEQSSRYSIFEARVVDMYIHKGY